VDAEAEVNDSNFRLTLNKNQVWRMKNKSLDKLARDVGIENVPTKATGIKNEIIERLSPAKLEATLKDIDMPAARNIYRLVLGKFPPKDMDLAAIKDMIRQDINENLEQVIDISTLVKNEPAAATNTKEPKVTPVDDLEGMNITSLRDIAKGLSIPKYSSYKNSKDGKKKLKVQIREARNTQQNESKSTEPTAPVVKKPPAAATNTTEPKVTPVDDLEGMNITSLKDIAQGLSIPKYSSYKNSKDGKKKLKVQIREARNTQQNESKSTEPTAPTEDEKQKKKFNEFWEIVKDMNKKDINNKILSPPSDVKNMLKELQKLLDKNGPYVPSFKARGDFLAGVADRNKNKTLTEDEIRKIIKNTPKLKELFRIGKTGELNGNLEPFVSWKISRTTIDTNKNGIYTLEEFAQYYLAAVQKKKARDQLTGTFYEADTFDTMLKLFGIEEEEEEEEEDEEDKETEVSPPAPPPAPQTTLPKLGDIVISKIKMLKERGLIGEISGTTAHVFWEDGSDETDNKLTDLVKVTISDDTESKIREIFDSYDTERTDGTLEDVEARNSLLDNIKATKVYRTLDQFNVDGIAGFSREEFRFLLTIRTEFIENWDTKQTQRVREADADKAAKNQLERQARQKAADKQKQEQDRQQKEEEDRQQKEEEDRQQKEEEDRQQKEEEDRQQKEEEDRQEKLKEEQAKQKEEEDEKRIIVEFDPKTKEYVVRQTNRSKVYQKELKGIPTNVCNPK